jgi:hypothetical protein
VICRHPLLRDFYAGAPYCNDEYLTRSINDHKAIPIKNYSTPALITELREHSKSVIDAYVSLAIDEGIGEYYNRDKKATSTYLIDDAAILALIFC